MADDQSTRLSDDDALWSIINAIPAIAGISSSKGSIEIVNDRWLEYTGIKFGEANEIPWDAIVHDDDIQAYRAKWAAALSSGIPTEAEVRLRRVDGTYRWFLGLATPIRDKSGKIVKWVRMGIDINARKLAEEALRKNETLLFEAEHIAQLGYWEHDLTNDLFTWSDGIYQIFGLNRDEHPPSLENFQKLIHKDDATVHAEALARIFRAEERHEIVFRINRPDGEVRVIHSVGDVVFDASGKPLRTFAFMQDVTAQQAGVTALESALAEINQLRDELQKENLYLNGQIDKGSMFEDIVGSSHALRRVLAHVAKVAPTDSTVFIFGENGTGKELVARAIHKRSTRSSMPFFSINCATIPPATMAEELFGSRQIGQKTDEPEAKNDYFHRADGGTIFLNGIHELTSEAQIELLRILQEAEDEHATEQSKQRVRIIVATSEDLKSMVDRGIFRQDLFYRLNVFPIRVPPLRERSEDIPLLVDYLTQRFAKEVGKTITRIQQKTLNNLQHYRWPGNIRELLNIVERAVILCDSESLSVDETWLEVASDSGSSEPHSTAVLTLDEHEKQTIENALRESRGRVSGPDGAAIKLGIPRSTLESKIKSHGIDKYHFRT